MRSGLLRFCTGLLNGSDFFCPNSEGNLRAYFRHLSSDEPEHEGPPRNEDVGYCLGVHIPEGPVFRLTPYFVTPLSMGDHAKEEKYVEVW